MKKYLVILMVVMALSLSACVSDDASAGSDTDSSSESTDLESAGAPADSTDADSENADTPSDITDADAESNAASSESTDTGSDSTNLGISEGEPIISDGYEKFSQLKIGMTEEEVNAILGEPVRVDKAYYYYNITVNGTDMEITVWINTGSGLVTRIFGSFVPSEYRGVFADSATDLSGADGLESGELNTYDACVDAFKTPGYLTSINEDGKYSQMWVNMNDGYMEVTFGADGSVLSFQGFC